MESKEDVLEQMDEAAAEAQQELEANLKSWSAINLIAWWTRWYLKAGHKRLGRILATYGRLMR